MATPPKAANGLGPHPGGGSAKVSPSGDARAGEVIALPALPGRREPLSENDPDVLIIGAGFAGLGGANVLRPAAGPFLLLEAEGGGGGRGRTEYDLLDGHPVEA